MSIRSLPTLTGPRVRLRAPELQDWAGRFALGNTPELHRMFGGEPTQFRELTEDAAKSWVDKQMQERFAWVIELEGRLIGSVRLHSVNYADHRAVLAIGILDVESLGKGLGAEAIELVAKHAFGPMGLHRISLRVLDFNARAIAAYRKVGFVEEGRERESALIDGAWHDDILMGLLPCDLNAAVAA
ncbi:MAG: GNAT family protein [Litoreibacter sp.]|nr:GNAT family protein [Litoreibacter sp.]MCY4335700.1 GNAT family protein [Litoreibacter sp.]